MPATMRPSARGADGCSEHHVVRAGDRALGPGAEHLQPDAVRGRRHPKPDDGARGIALVRERRLERVLALSAVVRGRGAGADSEEQERDYDHDQTNPPCSECNCRRSRLAHALLIQPGPPNPPANA